MINPHQQSEQSVQDWQRDEFFKSSFSGESPDTCVEVGRRPGAVAVRDSKQTWKDSPLLEFAPDGWKTFLLGAKAKKFDSA